MNAVHPHAPTPTGRQRRAVIVALTLLVLALGLAWTWWARRAPALPALDLSQATPSVRRTVETHLDEVHRQPRSAWAWGRLGSVLYAYRLNSPALTALAEAQRRDPANPRWPYLQAVILQYPDPPRAMALLRETVQRVGNEPPAPRLRLARWLAEQGQWDAMRLEIDALLKQRPDLGHAWILAAQNARQTRNLPQAIEFARRAANDPQAAKPALQLLAALLAQQGDASGATEAARKAQTSTGGDLLVDVFDAEAVALREDPTALSERVHPLLARGQLDAAADVVQRMVQDHPDYPDTWLAAGRLEFLRRQSAPAEAHFRKHLALDPASVQGWFQLGMTLLARNQNSEAADAFARAVQLKPDLGPAWHNRGLALGRLGRRDEAMDAFRQVLRVSPEHLDAYVLAADLQLQKGDPQAALDLLDRATQLNPNDRRVAALRQKAASSKGAPAKP
jgi:tetratricopeptide (TPR) repeat protein